MLQKSIASDVACAGKEYNEDMHMIFQEQVAMG